MTQIATAALTAAVTLYLVRVLDPGGFGDFSLALGIVGLLIVPADFGIAAAAGKLIAESLGERSRMAHVFRRALVQKGLVAGALSITLFALAEPLARLFDSDPLAGTLRGMSLALFGQAMFLLPDRTLVGLGRIQARFANVLQESAIEAASTVALVMVGLGAAGAALGRGIGYTAGAALGVLLVMRIVGGPSRGTREALPAPAPLVQLALPMFMFAVAWTAFVQIDAVIIGIIRGSEAVGIYQAPVRIVTFLGLIGLALAVAVAPRFATELGRSKDGAILGQTLRGLIIIHMALVPFIVVWATPLVNLVLGPDYGDSAPVLRALALFVLLQGVGPLLTTTVHYAGDLSVIRARVPITLFAIAINVVLDIWLIRSIGLVGAAIGTTVGFLVYLAPHVRICEQLIAGFEIRPSAMTSARCCVAAAACGAVLAAIGTSDLPAWQLVAGVPVGLVCYTAALMLVREVTPAEVRLVFSRIRSSAPLRSVEG